MLWIFGIFYEHSVLFVFVWYIFSSLGIMQQEKSGNPAWFWNEWHFELGLPHWSNVRQQFPLGNHSELLSLVMSI
jgi:hypothetical protein